MNEKSIIWVAYDTSKTDLSCVVCTEPNNGRAKMCVGYMGDDADELYKIVSMQGYLAEHDKKVRETVIEEIIDSVDEINNQGFHCIEDYCDDDNHDCAECMAKAILRMLERMEEGGKNGNTLR